MKSQESTIFFSCFQDCEKNASDLIDKKNDENFEKLSLKRSTKYSNNSVGTPKNVMRSISDRVLVNNEAEERRENKTTKSQNLLMLKESLENELSELNSKISYYEMVYERKVTSLKRVNKTTKSKNVTGRLKGSEI